MVNEYLKSFVGAQQKILALVRVFITLIILLIVIRLRCLHGKISNRILCVCTCTVGSSQCSRCVVYSPGAVAAY